MPRKSSKKTTARKSSAVNFTRLLASAEKELLDVYHKAIKKSSAILSKVGKKIEKLGNSLSATKKAKPAPKKRKAKATKRRSKAK